MVLIVLCFGDDFVLFSHMVYAFVYLATSGSLYKGIAAHSANYIFSLYLYLIVNLVFFFQIGFISV